MARVSTTEGGYGGGASIIHTDSSHSEYVSVPDADLLFRGDYHRAGPDLVLTGHDGRHHIVPGYFGSEKHAALVAPNGASLSADVVDLLAGSAAPGQYAQAQPTAPPDSIGKVEKVVGDVTLVRNGVSVALHVGDAVFKSDVIATGGDSSAGITFPDGTVLDLVANSRMALNEYSFEPNGANNGAVFTLVEGTFGFVAGQVAHDNHMSVVTPVATMGIRGTAGIVRHEFRANAGDLLYSFLVLDEIDIRRHGHHVGAYEVRDNRPDSPTFGEILQYIADSGYVTSVEAQGSGLPPIVTTEPITNSRLFTDRPILQDLVDSYSQFNGPGGIHSPGSGDSPNQLFGPQFLPENGGGNPINFIGFTPTGGTNNSAATTSFTTPLLPPETVQPVIAVTTPTQTLVINTAGAITGVSVSETNSTSGETFTATLTDNNGALSVNTSATGGGGTITSSNSGHTLTIVGTLSQVNADLTTLTDNDTTPGTDNITVTATDSLGHSATPQTINVTVNAPPTTTGGSVTTAEDHAYTFKVADFNFSDPVSADTLKSVTIDSLPTNGTLTDNGHVITASDLTTGGYVVSEADIAGGLLTFTPATDAATSFQFQVTDSLNNITSSAATMAITLTPAAEAPTVTATGTQGEVTASTLTVAENTTVALNLAASDPDSDGTITKLVIGGVPTDATLTDSHGSLTLSPDSPGGSTYTLTGTQLADALAGDLSLTMGDTSATTLTVTATNTEGSTTNTNSATLTVNVTPAAEAPTVTATGTQGEVTASTLTVAENTTVALNLAASDPDSDGTITKLVIGGVPTDATLTDSHGSLTLSPDSPGGSTYTLTGTQLADALAGDLSLTMGDTSATTLTVTATNTEGSTTNTNSATLTVNVTPAAEAPTVTATGTQGEVTASTLTVAENTTVALNLAASDPDSDGTITKLVIGGVPTDATLTDSHGSLTLSPDSPGGSTYTLTGTQLADALAGDLSLTMGDTSATTLTVTATNTEGSTTNTNSATLTVNVTPAAEAPTVTATGTQGEVTASTLTVAENTTVALNLAASDPDSDGTITKLVIGGVPTDATLTDSHGSLTLSPDSPGGSTYTLTGTQLADALAGDLSLTMGDTSATTLTVTATNTEGSTTNTNSATLTVNVTPAAEAPTVTATGTQGEVTASTLTVAENTTVALNLAASDPDSDGTITKLVIGGVPTDATLTDSHGSLTLSPDSPGGSTYTLTGTQLADALAGDLSLTMGDTSATTLTVTATNTEGSTTNTNSATLTVNVTPAAEAPTVTATGTQGEVTASTLTVAENTTVALNLAASDPDSDGTITKLVIGGVPTDATLTDSHGSLTLSPDSPGGSTYTLTGTQLADALAGDLSLTMGDTSATTLTVTATNTEGSTTNTNSATLTVNVTPAAEAPTVTATGTQGEVTASTLTVAENTTVALNLAASDPDSDGTITKLVIGGVPTDATLTDSHGSLTLSPDSPGGSTYTLTGTQLADALAGDLSLTMGDTSATTLTVTATNTEGSTTNTNSATLTVNVTPAAEAPTVTATGTQGEVTASTLTVAENTTVALNLAASDPDSDGTITKLVIGGVPTDATLTDSHGSLTLSPDSPGGSTYTLTGTQLADALAGDLSLTMGDTSATTLTVTATNTEGSTTNTNSATLTVNVTPAAEAPTVTATGTQGEVTASTLTVAENTTVALNLAASDPDSDGTITKLVIGGVPTDATLTDSHGSLTLSPDSPGGSTYTLTGTQLADALAGDLSLTMGDTSATTLTVTATNTEGSTTNTNSATLTVNVTPAAEAPTVTATGTQGEVTASTLTVAENTTVALNLAASDPDSDGTITKLVIGGVPTDATLTDSHGSLTLSPDSPGGSTYTLTGTQLADALAGDLSLTMGDTSATTLTVTATNTEGSTTNTNSATLTVNVTPAAEAPTVTATGTQGEVTASTLTVAENTTVALNLAASDPDSDGTITKLVIGGVPTDATLTDSHGSLTLSPDSPGGSTYTLTGTQLADALAGDLSLTMGDTSATTLTVTATNTEGSTTNTNSATLTVNVTPAAEAPTVTATGTQGEVTASTLTVAENTTVALNLAASDPDSDGTITKLVIGGVPTDATLTDSHGSLTLSPDSPGGSTYTLTGTQLADALAGDLSLTMGDTSATTLTVTATNTEGSTTNTNSATLTVNVTPAAEAPTVTATGTQGEVTASTLTVAENTTVALNLAASDPDSDGTITKLVIGGVPTDATLTDSHGSLTLSPDSPGGSTYTLTGTQLADALAGDLSLTMGDTSATTLTVTATNTEGSTTNTNSATLTVNVTPAAEAPTVTATGTQGEVTASTLTVAENTTVALNLAASDPDSDGTITKLVIGGVPTDATLTDSHGSLTLSPDSPGGSTYTLTGTQLADALAGDLSLTMGDTSATTLTVTATNTEGSTTNTNSATLTVNVTPAAEAPTVTATGTQGEVTASTLTVAENTTVALNLAASDPDSDGTITKLVIGGVPTDATLTDSHGSLTLSPDSPGGSTYTLTGTQLADALAGDLSLTMGDTSATTLTVTATNTEGSTTNTNSATLTVNVTPAAEAPTVTATGTQGEVTASTLTVAENTTVALNLAASDPDSDGTITKLVIGGVPTDATLTDSHGSLTLSPDSPGGSTYTLTGTQLADALAGDLSLTMGDTSATTLTVTATNTEGSTTNTNSATLTVNVTPAAEAPTVTATGTQGEVTASTLTVAENTTVALNLAASDPDSDGTITKLVIGGVPTDATLTDSHGSLTLSPDSPGGSTYTLTGTQLADALAGDLSLTMGDTSATTLTVTATNTEGSTTNTNSATLTVTVKPAPPTGFTFTPDTATLSALDLSSFLDDAEKIGTFTEAGGIAGDHYTFTIGGTGTNFIASADTNSESLSTGNSNVTGSSGGTVYALTARVHDTTNSTQTAALPFDVVVGSSNNDTINLETGTGNLGISATTPTIVYGLNGNDTINATGMIANVWFVGGGGSDTMTGGTGHNTYLYATQSQSGPNGPDTITNFHAATDVINLSAVSGITTIQGQISGSASINAHSIAWIQNGTATDVYINPTGSSHSQGNSNELEIVLSNFNPANLAGSNFILSNGNVGPAGVAGSPINLALANPSAANGGPVAVTISGVPSDWTLNEGTNLGNGTWTVQTNDLSALTVMTAAAYSGAMVLGVTETWTNADGSTGIATIADNVEAYAPGAPIFALSGNDTLTGAGGNDEFVFAQPIGNDTIHNFNVATDKIDLMGFANAASFSDIQANLTNDANGNAVITIGAGETITLNGVNAASLVANDFLFNQDALTNNAGVMVVSDGAMLPLSGTIDNAGTIAFNSTDHQTELQIIGDGVTLEGGGQVTLSGAAVIIGTGSAAVLTNVDNTISGAGQIGSGDGTLTLINETHGTIDANVAGGTFTLETGTTITNNGVLEALNGGTLQILDPVTGNGSAIIEGGTMIFGAQSNMNVAFENGVGTPTYGELVLGDAAGFSGQISGFVGTAPDTAHSDAIDLEGINYNSSSFSETYDAAKGLLTVTDGSHSASLTFDNFDGTLSLASDGNGGTLITDPPATRSSNPSPSISVGGPGNDTFVFHPGIGADTITSFNPQADTIELDHFANIQNVQQLAALIGTDAHGDAVIELGHNDSITLPGVAPTYLQQHLQSLVHLG